MFANQEKTTETDEEVTHLARKLTECVLPVKTTTQSNRQANDTI